jgi:hypothetical protein
MFSEMEDDDELDGAFWRGNIYIWFGTDYDCKSYILFFLLMMYYLNDVKASISLGLRGYQCRMAFKSLVCSLDLISN